MAEGGFSWGLTPGGNSDDESEAVPPGVPTAPPPAEPVDQGHFVAMQAEPAPTEPTAAPPSWDQPTQATPTWDQPTQALAFPAHAPAAGEPPPVDGSLLGVTEALAAQPLGFDGLDADGSSGEATSLIDSLFGEGAFQEYGDELVPGESPFAANPFAAKTVERVAPGLPGELVVTATAPAPAEPMAPLQKRLLIAAGAIVAALALVALFLAGTRMAPLFAAPPPEPAVPSAEPSAPVEVLGPVAPGDYAWSQLLGTECLESFTSAWDQNFTVVDCGQPHTAQLVLTGMFDDSASEVYPGFDELQSRIGLLCSSADGLDYAAAKGFSDIQISASFAATEAAWADGERSYWCFAQRAGEKLTTSIALPDRPAPTVEPTVAPTPEP